MVKAVKQGERLMLAWQTWISDTDRTADKWQRFIYYLER